VVEITLSRPEKAAMLPQTTGGIALYSTRYGAAALPQPRVFVVETEPDAQHQVVRGLVAKKRAGTTSSVAAHCRAQERRNPPKPKSANDRP